MSLMRLQSFNMKGRRLREKLVKTQQAWRELSMELFFTKNISRKTRPTGHSVKWMGASLGQKEYLICSVQTTAARGIKICEAATACIVEPRKKDGFGKHYEGRKSLISASCCRSVIGRTEGWGFHMSNITSKGMELMYMSEKKKPP